MIGAGARVNATGGIHRTTHQNVNVSNQQVDNSSTISNTTNHTTNNTTIVMGGTGEAKYCEVCGNPLEEKHPRCPKCGKQICFDCKVKGKNRCVECEKKAREEYRIAFQQLLLTTNGNLGAAGRQMMNNKARELDVEDVKADLEKDLMALYRPSIKPEQPAVAAVTSAAATAAAAAAVSQRATSQAPAAGTKDAPKGLGALSGGEGIHPQPKNNGNGGNRTLWFLLGGVVAVAVIAFLAFGGKGESTPKTEPQAVEQAAEPTQQAPQSVASQQATSKQPAAATKQATSVQQPAASKPATPATDANYEEGMKQFKAAEGLKAIECFKKSGSAQANYMLGVIYENGCGNVGSNAMMARKYYKKAADQGSAEAKAKL